MPQLLTEAQEPVNILYYGDGGTGKTTALASMANIGKVLAVNAESGIKARALRSRGVDIANIEVYPGPGEELTFEGLEAEWLRIREELHQDPTAYAGVFWDSVTEVQQAMKDAAVLGAVDRAGKLGRERSRFVIGQDIWVEVNEQSRSLIRKFRDLPCHFGMSALPRRIQDDDGAVVYQPAVTPALQNDLIGWVDIVCHTSIEIVDGEEEFRGLFKAHGKYRGKDRESVMPKWLVDPSFDRIAAYVDGELEVDTDPVMTAARERAKRATQLTPSDAQRAPKRVSIPGR